MSDSEDDFASADEGEVHTEAKKGRNDLILIIDSPLDSHTIKKY